MSATPINGSEPASAAKAEPNFGKQQASPALNKYEQVRLAKKKQRRRAHRLTIKRSNTGG